VTQQNAPARQRENPVISLAQVKGAIRWTVAIGDSTRWKDHSVRLDAIHDDSQGRAAEFVSDAQKDRMHPAVG
jgi:hypothetical protein